jgi:hypothetical protein
VRSATRLNPLARRVLDAVERLQLDLSGVRAVTEAATGPYVVTPVLAALAGAEVVALAKGTRHGSVSQVREETSRLADELDVGPRIAVVEALTDDQLGQADLVTNSGHLRPLDAAMVGRLKPTAVIPLMYEAWELRSTDVDLEACRRRGVQVAGTNERHPDVGVFDYLGLLVLKALLLAGHDLIGERALVISDNDFAPYVETTLQANGLDVCRVARRGEAPGDDWDVVVVATTPPVSGGCRVPLQGLRAGLFCQLWGDADRTGSEGPWCPERAPDPGHMGLTLPSLGPTPVVKLQAAGLKCAEVMLRGGSGPHADLVQWVQRVSPAHRLVPPREPTLHEASPR